MVAHFRRKPHLMARAALLAVVAGAFVLFSGLPAHAQYVIYQNQYPAPYPYYPNTTYGQPTCQTISYAGFTYTNCPATVYTPSPYYTNFSTPNVTPYTYYYSYSPYPSRDEVNEH